jgi:TrkA domain protein
MRTRTSTSIVAVVRDHVVSPSPGPEFVFRAHDLVVVVGTGEGLGQAAAILEDG